MKSEEPAFPKSKLTWGDLAFGLEVARWKLRRFFNRYELLRRLFGFRREPDSTTPGLLLIHVRGLSFDELTRELAENRWPFFRKLIEREHNQLRHFRSASADLGQDLLSPESEGGGPASRVANLPTEFKTHHSKAASASTLGFARKLSPQTRAGIDLMRGMPFVSVEFMALAPKGFPLPSRGEGRVRGARRGEIERIVACLYRAAQLSRPRDYEVWIVGHHASGFVLTPALSPLGIKEENSLARSELRAAIERVLTPKPSAITPSTSRRRSDTQTIRVMTYNIHSCVGLDGKLAPSRIARIIRGFDPDIVALQEVDLRRRRSRGEDQTRRLAQDLGMQAAFCCTVDRSRERYGHALLSKFPIEVIASGVFATDDRRAEPRGVLLARIRAGNTDIYVANTHFGLTAADRLQQMQTFLGPEWLGRVPLGAPFIACGDFNMSPRSNAYQLMLGRLRDAQSPLPDIKSPPTFPSTLPLSRIDFIFISEDLQVERFVVPRNSQTRVASDHLPVVAELRSRAPAQCEV